MVSVIWQYTGLSVPEMEQRVTTYGQYAISTSAAADVSTGSLLYARPRPEMAGKACAASAIVRVECAWPACAKRLDEISKTRSCSARAVYQQLWPLRRPRPWARDRAGTRQRRTQLESEYLPRSESQILHPRAGWVHFAQP